MTFASCLYVGRVVHNRLVPRKHRLRYRVFWTLLDLIEIDRLSKELKFFSRNRVNLTSFFDRDHGDGSDIPLLTQIETLLRRAGCRTERLTIKLLCMPRILGYGFNPLSIYFCSNPDRSLEAIVYEVHNTFGERHSYVLPAGSSAGVVEQSCQKQFYVSPFLGMDMTYAFRVTPPAGEVNVSIQGRQNGQTIIATALSGARRDLNDRALVGASIRHPLLTLKVIVGIHWQALRMVLKRFQVHARGPTLPQVMSETKVEGSKF